MEGVGASAPSAGWKGDGQRELVFDGVDSAPVRHPAEMALEALDDEGEAYRYLPCASGPRAFALPLLDYS